MSDLRDVLILGSGRSGTSLAAGCLAGAGYFMGDRLLPANPSNPKGFFEDIEVNAINEEILATVAPRRPPLLGRFFFRSIPLPYQRWLLALPDDVYPKAPPSVAARIEAVVRRSPYCLKDPRFSYTLPIWQPHMRDPLLLVVFRHPLATARSIVAECRNSPLLHTLAMDLPAALEVWRAMYTHVVASRERGGDWLFLHYEQILAGDGLARIAARTGARMDQSFPDPGLRRSRSEGELMPRLNALYHALCELADYRPAREGEP